MRTGDDQTKNGKRRRPTVDESLDFLKRLAQDPLLKVPENLQQKSEVLALRDVSERWIEKARRCKQIFGEGGGLATRCVMRRMLL